MSLPIPSFYNEKQVNTLYLERSALVTAEARKYAAEHKLRPASEDRLRIAAFGIDVQVGFCLPEGALFVPGAVEDTRRTLTWLYSNLEKITSLVFSLDTHNAFQIFHPDWWRDARGNPPAPMTVITAAEVRSGRWRATRQPEKSLAYCENLESSGRYVLTIWPYHSLLGSLGHALLPSVMEASLFHAVARDTPTRFDLKGEEPLTESYSVLSPEVKDLAGQKVGEFNQKLFDYLRAFDRVYVFGQAKSHCVLSTLMDLKQAIEATDRSLMKRIYILEDAMSPVRPPMIHPLPPALDFPRLADAGIQALREAGMRVVRTTDPIDA
ncbi:nicotinamidase [Archangium primigenium]|uniref:nicotinamidase n=1 Tax=[Archangium] primigenium TaxID=2792470 RepID=UPI00195E2EFC|nr:nicotinamidase [Archangium primigenium]MBM7114326.1 nicotinamidase [Archangium primigenium]